MKIPFVDLKAQHRQLEPELRQVFDRVMANTAFIQGAEVKAFEEAFGAYCGAKHVVAMNSGTAALHLTLLALGIGPGDEVITVAHTFIASSEAISAVGAKPVFVDVHPESFTMDPAKVEKAITPRTKALLPVHLYGQPSDMDALLAIAKKHKLALVEDACQAHGATYKGAKAGTLGTAGCFSFYPSKNLGCCGEGGAMVTDDPKLAEKVRLLREHGAETKYVHKFAGYNFRMEGFQGGFLTVKLKYLDGWNEKRRALAARYDKLLAGSGIQIPKEMPYAKHVYHLYVIQTDDREMLKQQLAERGIETSLHYPIPLHLQEAYRDLGYKKGDFPVTEKLCERILSLPMFPELSPEAVDQVAAAISEILRGAMVRG